MNTDELQKIAIENLADSCHKLIEIAEDKTYINKDTKQVKELFETITNQFTLVFTLKNAIHDLSKKAV